MFKTIQRMGNAFPQQRVRATNRTGATLTKGEIVALDLTGSDGDVDTFAEHIADTTPSASANPLANVITPVAGHLTGWIFLCAEDESIANDEIGGFILRGVTDLKVLSTTTVAAGVAYQATSDARTLTARAAGKAGIARVFTSSTSGVSATAKGIFDGWALRASGA